MTAWTREEADALRAAVVSGVLIVEYAGPPQRKIQYQSLGEMRSLLAEMEAAIADAAGTRSSYKLIATRKGV